MNYLNFSALFNRGGYSLPVLVELKKPEHSSWYFTSNGADVSWGGNLYRAVPMDYRPPSSQDGTPSGGTLEIIVDERQADAQGILQELLQWFDTADDKAGAEVVGIINENGSVSAISRLDHRHGTVSWDGKKITWNIGWDDRLNMQINPWSFTANALVA